MVNLSNEMLYAALDQLSVGIIIIDEEHRLVFFNQCISDNSGLTLSESAGRLLGELFTEYNDSRLHDSCESALTLGLPARLSHTFNPTPLPLYQKNFLGDKSRVIQQQISIKRISGENNPILCQIVIENVTHVVKKEKTLQKLADDNIIQRKKAEAANVSKSQFLANMSHEIRTPINGVLGMLTLLSDTQLSKTQQHFSKLATVSAEALLYLINDILDFSKIEAGKLDIEDIAFNLQDCIYESVQGLAIQAQTKGVEVIVDTCDLTTTFAIGDPGRLRQIITNLISNSIKFTEQGEIIIRVKTYKDKNNTLKLSVSVIDTGIGIPLEKCEGLFNAFTQVDASTTREYGGTGLGLTIVRQLCKLMGGDIDVTSEQGKGSEFRFSLSLGLGDQLSVPLKCYDENPVLLLTSNDKQRENLAKQLQCWTLNVESEFNEKEWSTVVDKINDDYYSVIIVDKNLPQSALQKIEQSISRIIQKQSNKPQVILLTSMDGSYEKNNNFYKLLKQNDCLHLINKPVKTSKLHSLLNNVFSLVDDPKPLLNSGLSELTDLGITHEQAKILVVEDNRINQEVALGLLKKIGYRAEVAKHGLHALEVLANCPKSDPYHIILMDCQMPEMDGYQTTIAIRSRPEYQDVKDITIIAMTANTMAGDQDKCLAAGMDDYLAKPINPSLLTKKLDYWLSKALPKSLKS